MNYPIRIHTASTGWIEGYISTNENPMTAAQIINAIPFESYARLWGDEVYFEIPVKMTEENARTEVEIGCLAFWPHGACMCIFFGRTPASSGDRPVAASPVNVVGKISGDISLFQNVRAGERIRVDKA